MKIIVERFPYISDRDVWETFNSNLRNTYIPNKALTEDKQLVGYRGKIPGRTYMPSNPRKYGVQFFCCTKPQEVSPWMTWFILIENLTQDQWWVYGWGARGKTTKGALWWRHHTQPTVIITLDLPKIRPPKNMFLGLRHNWNRRKCKRVFMIHNFENTESWEDKAGNT